MRNILYVALFVSFLGVGIYMVWPRVSEDDAVDAIVGEAANQDFYTMVCVAQGIRHRGNLRGVYGRHAEHNQFETDDTFEAAQEAWEDSWILPDRIRGTHNWGTLDDLAKLGQLGYKAKCGELYFY